MIKCVYLLFFNKIAQMIWVIVQNYLSILPICFLRIMKREQQIWPNLSSATQNHYETNFYFYFTQVLILIVIFAISVCHVELKKTKDNDCL